MFFRKFKYNILGILLLATVYSCSPVDIEVPVNEPVFVIETGISSIDSVLQLNAGEDGIFMCTDYNNESGYNIYSGTFTTEGSCDDFSQPHLSIKFKSSESAGINLLETLQEGELAYYEPTQSSLQHWLLGFSDNPAGIFSWHGTGINPIESQDLLISSEDLTGLNEFTGIYEVPGIFNASFTKTLIGFGDINCGLNVSVQGNGNQGPTEIQVSSGAGAIAWSNGSFGNSISIDSPGIYTAQVIDSLGCFIDLVVQLNEVGFDDAFNFGFEHITEEVPSPMLEGLLVDITYLNDEGTLYTSSPLPQLIDPNFSILDVEEFDLNQDGLPTMKIAARFSAMLIGDNGDIIVLENAEVVFAVAYDE